MSPNEAWEQALAKALAQGGNGVTAVGGNGEPTTQRQACTTVAKAAARGQSGRLVKSRSLERKTGRGDGARSPEDVQSAAGVALEHCLERAFPAPPAYDETRLAAAADSSAAQAVYARAHDTRAASPRRPPLPGNNTEASPLAAELLLPGAGKTLFVSARMEAEPAEVRWNRPGCQ